jgi:hypothetical protein
VNGMKSKRRVISRKNLPTRMPLMGTFVYFLMLDRVHAASWVWGAFGVLVIIGWIAWLFDLCSRTDVDLLP